MRRKQDRQSENRSGSSIICLGKVYAILKASFRTNHFRFKMPKNKSRRKINGTNRTSAALEKISKAQKKNGRLADCKQTKEETETTAKIIFHKRLKTGIQIAK